MHRRMSKENDIKPENDIKQNWSYGDLDNIAYFYLFFWTPLALFPDFTSFGKSTKSRKKTFHFFLRNHISALCANAQSLGANAQGLRWQLPSGCARPRRATLNMDGEAGTIKCQTPQAFSLFFSFASSLSSGGGQGLFALLS